MNDSNSSSYFGWMTSYFSDTYSKLFSSDQTRQQEQQEIVEAPSSIEPPTVEQNDLPKLETISELVESISAEQQIQDNENEADDFEEESKTERDRINSVFPDEPIVISPMRKFSTLDGYNQFFNIKSSESVPESVEMNEMGSIKEEEEDIVVKKESERVRESRKTVASIKPIKQRTNLTMDQIFEQRMLSEIVRNENSSVAAKTDSRSRYEKPKKEKYKNYHAKLLESYLNASLSRGKMVKYCEYDCFNSDDDSDEYESNPQHSSLFNRYGMTSYILECSSAKQLPKWGADKKTITREAIKQVEASPEKNVERSE